MNILSNYCIENIDANKTLTTIDNYVIVVRLVVMFPQASFDSGLFFYNGFYNKIFYARSRNLKMLYNVSDKLSLLEIKNKVWIESTIIFDEHLKLKCWQNLKSRKLANYLELETHKNVSICFLAWKCNIRFSSCFSTFNIKKKNITQKSKIKFYKRL